MTPKTTALWLRAPTPTPHHITLCHPIPRHLNQFVPPTQTTLSHLRLVPSPRPPYPTQLLQIQRYDRPGKWVGRLQVEESQ